MQRQIRKRQLSKSNKSRKQRGGTIYTFDFKDKIGGLPAYIPLNGTEDGDCPNSSTNELGFINYGMTKGGSRKLSNKRKDKKRQSNKKQSNKRRLKKGKTQKIQHRKH